MQKHKNDLPDNRSAFAVAFDRVLNYTLYGLAVLAALALVGGVGPTIGRDGEVDHANGYR